MRRLFDDTNWAVLLAIVVAISGCDDKQKTGKSQTQPVPTDPHPPIRVDGSSTVHPISEGVLDLYASRLVTDIDLQFSGTGGGFKRFCRGETDINGASRPIKSIEDKLCQAEGISYIELPVAFDGIAVVVPRSNDWVDFLTTRELQTMWHATSEGVVLTWKDIRDTFPEKALNLYGPGLDSGTFDFFTDVINGSSGNSRADYHSSEDDDEIAQKLAQDHTGAGYFGLSYQQRYSDRLRVVPIDDKNAENGDGAIVPTADSVAEGDYQPLSRPLFLYVNAASVARKEVEDFVEFYLRSARLVAPDVGAVGLTREVFSRAHERLREKRTGSAFAGIHSVLGLSVSDLLSAEQEAVTAKADTP